MENLVGIFGSGLGLIVILFLIVVSILGFLMPFFVFRIRNEMIELNEKAGTIISLLRGESTEKTEKADKGKDFWNSPYQEVTSHPSKTVPSQRQPLPPYGGSSKEIDPKGGEGRPPLPPFGGKTDPKGGRR